MKFFLGGIYITLERSNSAVSWTSKSDHWSGATPAATGAWSA